MSDIKISIGADIKDLQTKLAQAGGVTEAFAAKSTAASANIGKGFAGIASKSGAATAAISQVGGAVGELASVGQTLLTGGIIVAIPIIIAGLKSLADEFFEVSQQEKDFNETMKEGSKEMGKAIAAVADLTAKVELAKKGLADKDEVVKEYNESLGKTIGQVKTVEEVEDALISKGPAYIRVMGLKAAANYAFSKSGELVAEAMRIMASSEDRYFKEALINKLTQQAKEFLNVANAATTSAAILSSESGFAGASKKVAKEVKTVADVLDGLYLKISALTDIRSKIGAFKSTIVELVTKFKVDPNGPIIQGLRNDIKNLELQLPVKGVTIKPQKVKVDLKDARMDEPKELSNQLEAKLQERGKELSITIRPSIHIDSKVAGGVSKETEEIANIIKDNLITALEGVGEALGNLASGKGGIGDLFSGIFRSMGAGLKQLGKYFLQTAIEIKIFKELATKNPYLAAAAGVALILLGTVVQNATNKKNAFASGVRSFGGGWADINERGQEAVFLPRGSSVMPHNELKAYSGGGDTIYPTLKFGYDALYIAWEKGKKQVSRNG